MPTPAVEVLRTVLAYTAHQDLEICHWDVRQAFLQADMVEDIYVRLCDGCGVWQVEDIYVRLCGQTVEKPLWGCQSGRNFHLLLVSVFKEIGFHQCAAYQCLLRLIQDGRVVTIIAPHVDDLMVAGELDSVNWVREQFRQRLEIEDLGDLSFYMRCEVIRNREAWAITIRQTAYSKDICRRYRTEGVLGTVPYAGSRHLDGREDGAIIEDVPYREVVGSRMWAAVMTRLDISNAVRE
ncbi:unnamed protein product [Discosporangium mesarthrocarpum]